MFMRYGIRSITMDDIARELGVSKKTLYHDIIEKVYFPYEETALFVFAVRRDAKRVVLVLNTGEEIVLKPTGLVVCDDVLALMHNDTLIKFTDRTMMKIADLIEEQDGSYFFRWDDRLLSFRKA